MYTHTYTRQFRELYRCISIQSLGIGMGTRCGGSEGTFPSLLIHFLPV